MLRCSRLRKYANEWGTQLAGASARWAWALSRHRRKRLMNVIMPDVKYAAATPRCCTLPNSHRSTASPTRRIIRAARCAPWQPCIYARWAGNFLIMEHQLAESSVYLDIMKGEHPKLINGCYAVPNTRSRNETQRRRDTRPSYKPLPASALRDPRLG